MYYDANELVGKEFMLLRWVLVPAGGMTHHRRLPSHPSIRSPVAGDDATAGGGC